MKKIPKAAAVLYARDLTKVSAFYQGVAGLGVVESDDGSVVLESADFQLSLVKVPSELAASIHIESPPQRRQSTPLKLVLFVEALATARIAAAALGGELNPPEAEWDFRGTVVCDGHDPEGNVVQFRALAR